MLFRSTDTVALNVSSTSGIGQYQQGEFVYQGYSAGTSTASAKVVAWDSLNYTLTLTNIQGNFVSSMPIYGSKSQANYLFTNYGTITPQKTVIITSVPNPITANASNNWIANTTIQEFH